MNDRWLSVSEISEYLGITKDSVYKWVKEKGMPAHRLGKLWKFKTDEVDIWMRKGEANGAKSETRKNKDLEDLGFRLDSAGAHTARTIMVPELELLLRAVANEFASYKKYRDATITDNCLQKRSAINRSRTLYNLRILYGLDDGIPIFSLLKTLWQKDPGSLPQLAFLCAFARDKLIREFSPWMISHPEGSPVMRSELEEQIILRYPDRFIAITLRSTSQNLNASWAQPGYTQGRINYYGDMLSRSIYHKNITSYFDAGNVFSGVKWRGLPLVPLSREEQSYGNAWYALELKVSEEVAAQMEKNSVYAYYIGKITGAKDYPMFGHEYWEHLNLGGGYPPPRITKACR